MDIKKIFFNLLCCFTPNITTDNLNPYLVSKNIDNLNTKKFNLDGIKGKYYVKSVYDGDTITVIVPIHVSHYEFESSENQLNKKICM